MKHIDTSAETDMFDCYAAIARRAANRLQANDLFIETLEILRDRDANTSLVSEEGDR